MFRGESPLTLNTVPAGNHSLLIRLPGYDDYIDNLTVAPGEAILVQAALVPSTPPTPADLWNGLVIGALLVTFVLMTRKR
jgi:hypothetical protein